jgi:ABC-2 type transport system ATP-binding protein
VHTLAVSIRNLNKIYRVKNGQDFIALENLNLDIPKGSCCALLGPNGAGKSTLINILAGSVIKTSGSVKVAGYDLDTNPYMVKQNLGVVPQELSLDIFLSVYDSLEIAAGYYGIRSKDRKTAELLKVLDLAEKKNITARQLSGGMKRRVLVGRALGHNPGVLILDEPTAGVDIDLRDKLWNYIKMLNNEGKTIILTTHYLEEAENLCDYFVFINKGKILLQKNKADLRGYLSSRKIIIQSAKKLISVPQYLDQYTCDIEHDGHTLTFTCAASDLRHLLRQVLSDQELEILDVEIFPCDLETIFRSVMQENVAHLSLDS